MKAILLAAGIGTRLRPLTLHTPKCLVPINGIPLMTYWFNLFRLYNINEVLINLSSFPDQVNDYISRNANDFKLHLFYEDEPLGSLRTLIENRHFFADGEEVFIFYSDNLTNINLNELYSFHISHSFPFTMGLFRANKPKDCGIAELNSDYIITDFIEKPRSPKSNLANAGIYLTNKDIFNFIPSSLNKDFLDIGFDLLPLLINNMKGYNIPELLIDVGTISNLQSAEKIVTKHPELFAFMQR